MYKGCASEGFKQKRRNRPKGRISFLKNWDWRIDFENNLFMKYEVVRICSPHRYFEMCIANIKALATSKRWQFFYFATPFC